jgi:dTDP-4-amino-4,6-dideoxygalactose transaminase
VEPRGLDGECQSNLRKIIPPKKTRIIILLHLVGNMYGMDPIHRQKSLIIEDVVLALETKYKGRKLDNLGKSYL